MFILSYFTKTVGTSTLHGLPHRLQSSLTPDCQLSATPQPLQSNSGHFKPTLTCKSDNRKTSSLYSHSICSLAHKGSAGVLLCHSLGVNLTSQLPFCNTSCRNGYGGWEARFWEQISSPLCLPKITHLELVI